MGCNIAQENPLIGRWKSNKSETIIEIKNCGEYTEHQIALITSKITFGELVLDIDDETITSHYQGSVDTGEYKLLNIDNEIVRIESYNKLTDEIEVVSIEVQGDRMWMPSSLVNFREVFDKLK